MELQSSLLKTPAIDNTYNSIFNAHGLYNTERFVLRLSQKNHNLIDQITNKLVNFESLDDDTIQAYSTYLHETIHWWQHTGSSIGFILSMCYPLQTTVNINKICEWCKYGEIEKSIKSSALRGEISGKSYHDTRQGIANLIVNNTMDIEFFKKWILKPSFEQKLYNDPYFESQGNCFHIVYSNLFNYISKLIDPTSIFLHDNKKWEEEFKKLKINKALGYYYGSPLVHRRVGIVDIFEGQACFSQMYFLANIRNSVSDLNSFKECGMLHGVYEHAFNEFIKLSKLSYPKSVLDPTISLFLLVCDLSINPVDGFPCDIKDFSNFIYHNDPGIRFEILSRAVNDLRGNPALEIKEHSKDEYMNVSSLLLEKSELTHPHKGWDTIYSWIDKTPEICKLMDEHDNLDYSSQDTALRLMLSHFISFTLDKRKRPEFFCWPAYWKSNNISSSTLTLWLKHLSLFTDREDNDGIFIRQFPGKSEESLSNTLNNFFGNNLFYDLSRQWILQDGEFYFNFKWLVENRNEDEWKEWADQIFKSQYGVTTSEITY